MNLKNISKKLRKNILTLTHQAKSSHIGSCLSIVDILTVLYLNIIKKKNNDRFILSKGHATLALYCVLHHKNIINNSFFLW
jgi:transketolase